MTAWSTAQLIHKIIEVLQCFELDDGVPRETRTPDPLITYQLLLNFQTCLSNHNRYIVTAYVQQYQCVAHAQ